MAGGGIDLHQSPAAKAVHLSSQQKKAMTVSAHLAHHEPSKIAWRGRYSG
jgi:hypothetical protein